MRRSMRAFCWPLLLALSACLPPQAVGGGAPAGAYPYPTQPQGGEWRVQFRCPYGTIQTDVKAANDQRAVVTRLDGFGQVARAADLERVNASLAGLRFYGGVSASCEPARGTVRFEALHLGTPDQKVTVSVSLGTARGIVVDRRSRPRSGG